MWSGSKTPYLKQSIALTLLICTTACGNSSGSSANPDGNNSGSAGSGYEVVTVTKPENLRSIATGIKMATTPVSVSRK
jgi:hypothetical protein